MLVMGMALCCWLIPANAWGETVRVADLEEDPRMYDRRTVTVQGELVGDYSVRRSGVWLQLNDDPYALGPLADTNELRGGNVALGVLLPLSELGQLERQPPGAYGVRGPIVEVSGIFRYHDPSLGGETYLDAVEFRVVESARAIDHPVRRWPAVVGLTLVALAAILAARTGWKARA